MILHLERKFTAPTETYIANQINFQHKYKSIAFTTKSLNNLTTDAQVFDCSNRFYGNILLQKQIKVFREIFDVKRPSLIHGHFLTDSAFFHSFSKTVNIPKVCSGYGYDVSNFPKKYFGLGKLYLAKVFKEYNAFIAMSEDMAKDMIKLGCDKKKIIVHYYGTDTAFFNIERVYDEKEVFKILTVASLVPKKGHLTVLKALKLFKQRFPDAKFKYEIVGKGPLLDVLSQYVKSNGLENNVAFLGMRKYGGELLDVIRDADIFVHPSVTDSNGGKEGIPGTVVEAMAAGLPVISTYHAGIPEIIANEKDGFLVKENDDGAIANLVYELWKSKELRLKIGQSAKISAVSRLDIRIRTENLISIYNSFL